MEQVALAWLVNDGIRTLAERLDVPAESHVYSWVCACGCFTMVTATLAEYDRCAGQVFAAGHPNDAERAAATAAFQREPDAAAVVARVDEQKRRALTAELARQLEGSAMTNDGPT
jgi:hypothetical protein